MNKEITIYELLGLIKDGQAPEVIRYKQLIYCKEFDGYYTSNELKLKLSIMNDLNAKVEIIEDKKIEIDRLNNIINGLEKHLNQEIIEWQDANDLWTKAQVQEDRVVLNKLKELKEKK